MNAVLGMLIFINICRSKFSPIEIIAAAALAFAAYFLNAEILGNIIFTLCLAALAWRRTANLPLSGYYATLSVTILIMGGTIVGVAAEYALHGNIYLQWAAMFVICFPLSRFIGGRLHNTYLQLSHEVKQKFAVYGFIISALIYILAHANMFLYDDIDDQIVLFAVVILVFFVATIMTAAYSLNQQKLAEAILKREAEIDLGRHTKQLQTEYDDMRSFRHDFRNLLYALLGYDDIDELKKHLKKSLAYADESLKNLDSAMNRLNNINIPELKGLLAVKFAHAQAIGIDVELDIGVVNNISLNRLDLCRLAGIIADNAIEQNTGKIKFSIVVDGEDTLIICSNPCENPPPVRKIFDEGYSTKGAARGYGLANLKRICKENDNLSYTINTEGGEFTIILIIREMNA